MSSKPWAHARKEFTKISNHFLQTAEFTCYEKVVLLCLISFPTNCRPNYHTLRRATNLSRATIAKVLRALVADKVIEARTYHVRPLGDWHMLARQDVAYELGRTVDHAACRDAGRRIEYQATLGACPPSQDGTDA